ncbi:2-phosphosulfolactate phosphatase [Paenibacillus arenilitoris]|uniref:Probable 2-phosphosulfolactate phosphatase n=1 Tax=Paenibacillus arenilitoris TaxID=2772299 RepID=A0A927CL44_9BACL|nr:2-phosphosulfolactate phosphatase [Paenibacillus arenilitoris]MBD2869544.1 2-phosphosulfolactate phosphatase [Paenibacillus arenilitoris]
MQVQVISSVNEASTARFHHKTAVIIDALRATSTIVTAIAAGALCVIPAETVMEARALQRPGDLLGGERFCRRIAGFDLGNSPEEYTEQAVAGKRIVLTTTNGTRAIHKAMRADYVLTASFLNADACARAAVDLRRDVVILCAGSHDEFAIEDGLCAGLVLDRMHAALGGPIDMDDFGTAMLAMYKDRSARLKETIMNGSSGKRLLKLGMKRDIEACSAVDVYREVPRLNGDQLTRG